MSSVPFRHKNVIIPCCFLCSSSFSLFFFFKPPPPEDWNGDLKGYYVGYRQNSAKLPFTYNTVEAADDTVYYVLRGLRRGTRYLVTVRSFNDVGSGPSTEDIPVKTLDQGNSIILVKIISMR